MDKPSEEARYLASWLMLHLERRTYYDNQLELWVGAIFCNEDELVKEIDEYFNSRR